MKPVESAQQSLLDFDLGESSDDSDFRIEDHCEESDDDDDSVDSNNVEKGELQLKFDNDNVAQIYGVPNLMFNHLFL